MAALGEVQTPAVCFSSCQIVMEEVYKDVPIKYQAILVNQTLLPTRFSLGQVMWGSSNVNLLHLAVYYFTHLWQLYPSDQVHH